MQLDIEGLKWHHILYEVPTFQKYWGRNLERQMKGNVSPFDDRALVKSITLYRETVGRNLARQVKVNVSIFDGKSDKG